MTYEENVRRIAEEFSYSDYPGYKNSGDELPQFEINKSHEKARISVRLQAEELTGFAVATGACTLEYLDKYII